LRGPTVFEPGYQVQTGKLLVQRERDLFLKKNHAASEDWGVKLHNVGGVEG